MIIYSALMPCWHPFDSFFPDAEHILLGEGENPDRSDLDRHGGKGFLVLWGGEDIHPTQYNRENMGSHKGTRPSWRDLEEERMLRFAASIELPSVGVCRGAQLACAIAGGILAQDVSGHGRDHPIECSDGSRIIASSLHHQMMFPFEVEHKMLAWSAPSKSMYYRGLTESEEAVIEGFGEPEVVWFPQLRNLAIQGHPEFMDAGTAFNRKVHQWLLQSGIG